MASAAVAGSPARTRSHDAALMLLAAWIGVNLRATILAVPPVLGHIGGDLNLSHTELGLLTSIPVLCFGAAAIPGSRIVSRLGGHRTVAIGLWLLILGTCLRSLNLGPGGGVFLLFFGTALLGAGVGVAQPAVPRILRAWLPGSVQRASVIVTLGYITGQLVAASITLPILVPLTGGWRQALLFWALPAVLAVIWWHTRPRDPGDPPATARAAGPSLLHSRQLWTAGIMLACTNLIFFTANTWVGGAAPGGADGPAAELDLIVLNAVSLPVALVLASLRIPFVRSRAYYALAALPTLCGAFGWMLMPRLGPLWMAMLGGGSSMAFSGLVAFPATLPDASRIAPFSAWLWTIASAGAFLGPFLGGAGIDAFHWASAPFIPIAAAATLMLIGAVTLPTGSESAASG